MYYHEVFEDNKINNKNIWAGIREIVNIRNSKPHKIAQLKVGGKIINNSKDVSNKLNEWLTWALLLKLLFRKLKIFLL